MSFFTPPNKSGTLVLIEDDPLVITEFRVHFERLGYKILTAPDHTQSISFLRQLNGLNKKPDLIVIDFQLTPVDGTNVCRQLKNDAQLSQIPIIIFSEQGLLSTMTEAFKAGAEYFVVTGTDGLRSLEIRTQTILMRQLRRN